MYVSAENSESQKFRPTSEHNLCTEFKMEDMKHINIEIVVSGVSFLFNSTCGLANFFYGKHGWEQQKTQ